MTIEDHAANLEHKIEFGNLERSQIREIIAAVIRAIVREERDMERERCAKIADAQRPPSREEAPAHWQAYEAMWDMRDTVAKGIARTIREARP